MKGINALLAVLSYGQTELIEKEGSSYGLVETLARVYERARNALEYRAGHLVRRAAIERILKRIIILGRDPAFVTEHLLTELRWAKYLSMGEIKTIEKEKLEKILEKYLSHLNGHVPQDWLIKMASSEVEEQFSLNTDYAQFTFFAFQVIKQKIEIKDENSDLLIFFAVDKVYGGSDDEQISYHILKLAGENIDFEKIKEAYSLFNYAKGHKALPKIIKFARRQMPPLVLLRDIYFFNPQEYKETIKDPEVFQKKAEEVLEEQLSLMSGKVQTAGIRSIIYVFLTKMILAFGMEVPLEIFIYGTISKLPLIINIAFPPFLMWLASLQVNLPKEAEKKSLIKRARQIIDKFDEIKDEEDKLYDTNEIKTKGYPIFSALYLVFFIGVFALIFFALSEIGFTLTSQIMFIFFLTIIAFFAYRIRQIAKVYSWKNEGKESSSLLDIIAIPILSIGSRLSVGLSKLNFLAFAFDFILEAPFKIILGFIDDWVQFLSIKKEEEIIE